MKILGVIPARYASTRVNGKPLELICGKPMIEWVYKRSVKSKLDNVVVATDDKRIYDTVLSFGGKAVMTRSDHSNGTDRIIEVIKFEEYKDYEFVITIQGDEPIIDPESINILIVGLFKPFPFCQPKAIRILPYFKEFVVFFSSKCCEIVKILSISRTFVSFFL